MIPLWKKQFILDRLNEVNGGKLDFLTINDIIIEPMGDTNAIDSGTAKNMINGKLYGGPYANLVHNYPSNYERKQWQIYKLRAKNTEYITGEILIGAYLLSSENTYTNNLSRNESQSWYTISPNSLHIPGERQNLKSSMVIPMSIVTSITSKNNIQNLTDDDIINILPKYISKLITLDDVGEIEKTEILDNNVHVATTIRIHFKRKEDSIYAQYNIDNASIMFIILNNNVHTNLKKTFFNGNTDDLSISISDGDIIASGCVVGKESGIYSTFSLIADYDDNPELFDKIELISAGLSKSSFYVMLSKLSIDAQQSIIEVLSKMHHWKWGKQNLPNLYNETPSSHNLYNAKVIVAQTPLYASPWSSSGFTYNGKQPTNLYADGYHLNTYGKHAFGLTIVVDSNYNTGYDGFIRLYIVCKQPRIYTDEELNECKKMIFS